MFEFYELLYWLLVPKRVAKALETVAIARVLQLIWTCTLVYYSALFIWHGCKLLARFEVAKSPQQSTISPFWQIAAMALLTAQLHVRIVMAG